MAEIECAGGCGAKVPGVAAGSASACWQCANVACWQCANVALLRVGSSIRIRQEQGGANLHAAQFAGILAKMRAEKSPTGGSCAACGMATEESASSDSLLACTSCANLLIQVAAPGQPQVQRAQHFSPSRKPDFERLAAKFRRFATLGLLTQCDACDSPLLGGLCRTSAGERLVCDACAFAAGTLRILSKGLFEQRFPRMLATPMPALAPIMASGPASAPPPNVRLWEDAAPTSHALAACYVQAIAYHLFRTEPEIEARLRLLQKDSIPILKALRVERGRFPALWEACLARAERMKSW